jgi:hypothetical protein
MVFHSKTSCVPRLAVSLWVALALTVGCRLRAAPPLSDSERSLLETLQHRFTTKAYEKAAAEVMLADINQAVQAMELSEPSPIQKKDLIRIEPSPPFISAHYGVFGLISTRQYHYFASIGNKLSFIIRNFGENGENESAFMESVRIRYTLPKSQLNTNAAYDLARKWLMTIGVDVTAIEKTGKYTIRQWDLGEDKFVPIYWVTWGQPAASSLKPIGPSSTGFETVASVRLVEPDKVLLQMRVEKSKYIKRRSLAVPDKDRLLEQTEDSELAQVAFTTEAYKEAALQVMLSRVNALCQALDLPLQLPIKSKDVTEAIIETSYIADHLGSFATLYTERYIFAAQADNKLSFVTMNFRDGMEPNFLSSVKKRYTMPKSQISTNAAYALASLWLEAIGVDVRALERDCKIWVSFWDWDTGSSFVPLYEVHWTRNRLKDAAFVALLEPERLLKSLIVYDPAYIKSDPISLPNRDQLLYSEGRARPNRPLHMPQDPHP